MPTSISWTQETWNPVHGCSHVSEGCRFCYAEALSLRHGWTKKPWIAPHAAENVTLKPDRINEPIKWRAPRMVFTCSMADLFHEEVPYRYLDRVFGVMARASQHTFQVLTKRPERMLDYIAGYGRRILVWVEAYNDAHSAMAQPFVLDELERRPPPWPLPNVWLGVSAERQQEADQRIPLLLQTPAALRFVSAEPLLGPLDLREYLEPQWYGAPSPKGDYEVARLRPRVDWLIAGGESGINHRPMDLDWARVLRDQCAIAGIPFHYKQGAGRYPGKDKLLDGIEHLAIPERRTS